MKLKDAAAYESWKAKQIDPEDADASAYGLACFDRAERWAKLMEAEIEGSKVPFAVIAERTEQQCGRDADAENARDAGLTGFMYGMVIHILARCWVHGEDLRLWHNLKMQIRDEGEKANREGGVLNPAVLSFGGEA